MESNTYPIDIQKTFPKSICSFIIVHFVIDSKFLCMTPIDSLQLINPVILILAQSVYSKHYNSPVDVLFCFVHRLTCSSHAAHLKNNCINNPFHVRVGRLERQFSL